MSNGRATILLADPSWRNLRDVRVGALMTGWRANGVARLSARLRARDAHLLGFPALLGRWVWVNTPAGPWGGYVEDTPVQIDNETIELSCADMGGVLDTAITPRTYRQSSGTAGALIARAINQSGSDEPLPFDAIACDEDGSSVTIEWRGDRLGRVVQSLAANAGGLWSVTVDASRAVTFTYLAGSVDKRGSILLWEGRDALAGTIRPSISQLVNDLLGIANDRDWQRASGARVIDGDSILTYGRRRDVRRYLGHTRRSSLEGVARADLAVLSQPSGPVSLELRDRDPIVAEIREGHLIALRSGSLDRAYDLTVTGRAWDANRGVCTIVGTVAEAA